MTLQHWFTRSTPQPGAPGLHALTVSYEQWRQVAEDFAAAAGRLLALWASADEHGTPTIRAGLLAEGRDRDCPRRPPTPRPPTRGSAISFPQPYGCSEPSQISRDFDPPIRILARGYATQPGRKTTDHSLTHHYLRQTLK